MGAKQGFSNVLVIRATYTRRPFAYRVYQDNNGVIASNSEFIRQHSLSFTSYLLN